jgi:hypothetical protein
VIGHGLRWCGEVLHRDLKSSNLLCDESYHVRRRRVSVGTSVGGLEAYAVSEVERQLVVDTEGTTSRDTNVKRTLPWSRHPS